MIDSHLQEQLPAANYFSGQALQAIKASPNDQQALKAVAKQFEAIFIQMLMTSMRQANAAFGEDGLLDSKETKFYESMFDNQIALTLSESKGVGLADAMVRQLSPWVNGHAAEYNSEEPTTVLNRPTVNRHPLPESGRAPRNTDTNHVDDDNVVAAQGNSLFHSIDDFVQTLYPVFRDVAKRFAMNPKMLLAQAALETGWGKHIIRDSLGNFSNNLFSIKADRRWSGDKVVVNTLEYRDGIAAQEKAPFRLYDSFQASAEDFVQFINSNQRYRPALAVKDNPKAFIKALHHAGYATDPHYADKVIRLYDGEAINNSLRRLQQGGLL